MKSIKLVVFTLFILPATLQAQKATLINSTKQIMKGGKTGRSGTHYMFVIEFESGKTRLKPDTFWIGNHLVLSSPANTQKENTKTGVQLRINADLPKDEYTSRHTKQGEAQAPLQPPYNYNGAALLGYTYKGVHHYCTINKIMKTFPPLNYP